MANAQALQAAAAAYCRILADGKAPETLDVPDPFTGRTMQYRRTATGFRIFSVGPNGVDDGGKEDDVLLESPK
jgi:hypothetical protein